jgi:hypothetical protein
MSADPKPVQGWNAVIEVMKATSALHLCFPGIEKRLTEFRKHKEELLSHLQDAYEGGQKAEPFDRDKSWSEIEYLAISHYGWHKHYKEHPNVAADRRAKLHKIADALKVIETAMPDVGGELLDSWEIVLRENGYIGADRRARLHEIAYDLKLIETILPSASKEVIDLWKKTLMDASEKTTDTRISIMDTYQAYREFDKVITGLAVLRDAAVRAATEIKVKLGRRRGSSDLNSLSVYWLAQIYRIHTGLKPGAGDGPFARFAVASVTALGVTIQHETIVDIIKEARAKARRTHNALTPSPFEN